MQMAGSDLLSHVRSYLILNRVRSGPSRSTIHVVNPKGRTGAHRDWFTLIASIPKGKPYDFDGDDLDTKIRGLQDFASFQDRWKKLKAGNMVPNMQSWDMMEEDLREDDALLLLNWP